MWWRGLAGPLAECELAAGPQPVAAPAERARLPPQPPDGGAVRVSDVVSGQKACLVLHFDGTTGWELVEAEGEGGGSEPVFVVAGGASSSSSSEGE